MSTVSLAQSNTSGASELQSDEQGDESPAGQESLLLYDDCGEVSEDQHVKAMEDFQRSLAKMKEFRAVAPVPGFGNVTSSTHQSVKLLPPPSGTNKKTLNGSLRARRLKEIKADNIEVFERIKRSSAHYRNDDLQRDWHQHVSYLSSIGEFPVSKEALVAATSPQKQHQGDDDHERCIFGPSPRRSPFLRTPNRGEPLPSIQLLVVAYPIKSIPTSPKRLQLNMSPAFRSLRKAMPQQPSLPPISSPSSMLQGSGATDPSPSSTKNVNGRTPSSPRGHLQSSGSCDLYTESISGRSLSSRNAPTTETTAFIGDLQDAQAEGEVSGDAKYQLLKTGRFVGGTYLVLTVFCGDGVTNPYGFDVFAFHQELHCEYKLSITKEMTHELLDKSSSTSLAAATAAAAGTNLSMQEIARRICDHVNFAVLGADQGEMIFLVSTLGSTNDQMLLVDTPPSLLAFCVHQSVEFGEMDDGAANTDMDASPRSNNRNSKRRAHVFASTCPPKSYPANRTSLSKQSERTTAGGFVICFQLMDDLPSPRARSSLECVSACSATLAVKVDVDELYATLNQDYRGDQARRVSVDRMVVAAIRHLHIIAVPEGESANKLRDELIVNAHVNALFQLCSSRAAGTAMASEKKRSKRQLPRSPSLFFKEPMHPRILVQSGLIWKSVYLLVQVVVDGDEATATDWLGCRRLTQDMDVDLMVSVFNPNSGQSSCRTLSPETVVIFSERLTTSLVEAPSSSNVSGERMSEPFTFAKRLLTRLQLDVDLFGHEVIVFPALEQAKATNTGGNNADVGDTSTSCSPRRHQSFEKERDAAVLLQAQIRGFLCRRMSWQEGSISEGDEHEGSYGFDEESADELAEMRSDDRQLGHEDTRDSRPEDAEGEEEAATSSETLSAPNAASDGESSGPHSRKQGRKIDGHYCLFQDSPDGPEIVTSTVRIASLGQLEVIQQTSECAVPRI
ncbi:hypothetical protein BBJ28_00019273 [Nothophytophthora sp. Chile5]|nr:hypothetical protein BBJ28_00019273 [Nothophytophthora sp. Chile5]